MGKVIRASLWTCRSLLSLYSKVIAFMFAVFCVVSGLSAKVIDGYGDKKLIRGKVYWSVDSSIAKNIKLYMGEYGICPLYGTGYSCYINVVDSVNTDSLGYFVAPYPEALFKRETGTIVFAHYSSNPRLDGSPIAISDDFLLNSNSDTSIVIYLHPNDANGVYQEKKPIAVLLSKTVKGNTISIKIGNWAGGNKYSAKIIDITGKLVASPKISYDGVLSWNAERFSQGVYLINVKTDQGLLSTKIAVK